MAKTTIDGYNNHVLDNSKPQQTTKDFPRCLACQGYHGGVNLELTCLRQFIAVLKQQITTLELQIEAFKRPLRESLNFPCSKGGMVEARRNAGKKATSGNV